MKGNSPLFANYCVVSSRDSGRPYQNSPRTKAESFDLKQTVPKKQKKPIFDRNGHVTIESISNRREFFLGKSVARMEHELQIHGYQTKRRASSHSGSKAKIIMAMNPGEGRNITQVQISPGSHRHGDVPYVKISTSDQGRIKIIGTDEKSYRTDGKEKATLLFRRKK